MKELAFEKTVLPEFIIYWREFGRWQAMVLIINIAVLFIASYYFESKIILCGITFAIAWVVVVLALTFHPQYRYFAEAPIIAFAFSSPPGIATMIVFYYQIIINWFRIADFRLEIELLFFLLIIAMSYTLKISAKNCLSTINHCSRDDSQCFTKGWQIWLSALSQIVIMIMVILSIG